MNVLTGKRADLLSHTATHMDVNAIVDGTGLPEVRPNSSRHSAEPQAYNNHSLAVNEWAQSKLKSLLDPGYHGIQDCLASHRPLIGHLSKAINEQFTYSCCCHRRCRPNRLFTPVPHCLRRYVRSRPAGHPASDRNRTRSAGSQRGGDGTRRLRVPVAQRASCRRRISTKVFAT